MIEAIVIAATVALILLGVCIYRAATSAPITEFKTQSKVLPGGPTYELVNCWFNKPIHRVDDAQKFFEVVGVARGPLVRVVAWNNQVFYHYPEDYLKWRHGEKL